MIGRLAGRLIHRGSDHVMIDVRGVGYIVFVSDRVMAGLPPSGQAVALYTDLVVREDLLQLFGFPTLLEKEWHRLLIGVQGVGAKAALAIQGALGPEGLSRAIALGDWSAVAKARGVGPKTAQRVVLELKDKAPAMMAMVDPVAPDDPGDPLVEAAEPSGRPVPSAPAPQSSARAEALSALGNLGYGPSEAAGAVAQAMGADETATTPALIRAALKLLAPKG